MSGITTGFNAEEIRVSIRNIVQAYNSLYETLNNDIQNKIINEMRDAWACQDAVNFFKRFTTDVNGLISNVNSTFEVVVDTMNNEGLNWARSTGSEGSFSKIQFNPIKGQVDSSCIQENIGGDRGIDLARANSIIGQLKGISASVTQSVDSARNAVNNCGFIGGSMASNLQASLQNISKNVSAAIENLMADCNERVNSTISSYGDKAGEIAAKFASMN